LGSRFDKFYFRSRCVQVPASFMTVEKAKNKQQTHKKHCCPFVSFWAMQDRQPSRGVCFYFASHFPLCWGGGRGKEGSNRRTECEEGQRTAERSLRPFPYLKARGSRGRWLQQGGWRMNLLPVRGSRRQEEEVAAVRKRHALSVPPPRESPPLRGQPQGSHHPPRLC
jgi:hypothetical protein